jgi:diguanylate cyclase (GGDEF)-like protein
LSLHKTSFARLGQMTDHSFTLDFSTLYLVATLVAAMLGGLLLFFWRQERIAALGWWGAAYLVGGVAIATWTMAGAYLHPAVVMALNVVGLVACGMVWNAARVFHGKPTSLIAFCGGAVLFALAGLQLGEGSPLRLMLGAAVVAAYAVLTASELWSERRKAYKSRWPAVTIPVLHGVVLMLPVIVGDFLRPEGHGLGQAWIAAFTIELVLYAVGTVFIIFLLVSERTVTKHKAAASIDPLTELFNRRGFSELSARMIEREAGLGRPVSVLIFDLDHFKSVNDRFGHAAGDEILKLFARILLHTLRVTDIVARVGGEEFAALLSCSNADAIVAADRIRATFESAGVQVDDVPLSTTVSVGVATGAEDVDFNDLLAAADTALYRAKRGGRNRVEVATETEQPQSLDRARRAATVEAAPHVPTVVHQFDGAA